MPIRDIPNEKTFAWRDLPLRRFAVTDMKYHSGFLYVAGLSNAEFSSTFRQLKVEALVLVHPGLVKSGLSANRLLGAPGDKFFLCVSGNVFLSRAPIRDHLSEIQSGIKVRDQSGQVGGVWKLNRNKIYFAANRSVNRPTLEVHPYLEDTAGNRVGASFENIVTIQPSIEIEAH